MRVLEKDPMCGGLLWKPRALLVASQQPVVSFRSFVQVFLYDPGRIS